MSHKFKIGDIVRCVSTTYHNQKYKGKIGKIINIDENNFFYYLIKFLKPIKDGHDGWKKGKGKPGYCWTFNEHEIKLHISILKLFLKEKALNRVS